MGLWNISLGVGITNNPLLISPVIITVDLATIHVPPGGDGLLTEGGSFILTEDDDFLTTE